LISHRNWFYDTRTPCNSVIRDGQPVVIANAEIVPGDVVILKPGVVCCDMAVLKAERLVVDESALTGEANPIVKSEIDPTMAKSAYDPHRHKRSILSAGTEIHEVSETEGKELGLVLATGSFTTKGKLVTDVLSYQRHKFKFDDEVKIVLCILIAEAAVMLGLVFHFIAGEQWVYAWFYGKQLFALMRANQHDALSNNVMVALFLDTGRNFCSRHYHPSLATNCVRGVCWYLCQAPPSESHYLHTPGGNSDCWKG
jgi:magnesium-transporting ATPase (P-type)